MPKTILRILGALSLFAVLLTTGCSLDPMEKLSEDIDAQEQKVREKAVLDLANLRDDRALEALVEVLQDDEEDSVSDLAGVALVKQGRDVVTDKKPDPIITMVGNVMKNVHLAAGRRCRAAWVLGEIGDREAIPTLRAGSDALDAAGAAAQPVRDQANIARQKLGDQSTGVAFDLKKGLWKEWEQVDTLPVQKSLAPPEAVEEDEEPAPAKKAPVEKKPAAKKANVGDKSASLPRA